MGIENLLKFVGDVMEKSHLKNFSGLRVGIDGYCWLHRSIYAKNMEMAIDSSSTAYIYFLKEKIKTFKKFGVQIIFIFDGAKLPIKSCEEEGRNFRREKIKEKAAELMKQGKIEEAKQKLISAIDISRKIIIFIF